MMYIYIYIYIVYESIKNIRTVNVGSRKRVEQAGQAGKPASLSKGKLEISADGSFSRPIKGGYKDIDRIISYTVVIYYDRSSYLVE